MAELRSRVLSSVHYQEGDQPVEDPGELLAEADQVAEQLEHLIGRINATNIAIELLDGRTMTEALAYRDVGITLSNPDAWITTLRRFRNTTPSMTSP